MVKERFSFAETEILHLNEQYLYDLTVFIGRFQIFHEGHKQIIETAMRRSKYLLLVAGSINEPRSPKNPLFYKERVAMIREALPDEWQDRIVICGIENRRGHDDMWAARIQSAEQAAAAKFGLDENRKTALIGHKKDRSSYYLGLFPQWDSIAVENYRNISSTNLRNSYFSNIGDLWLKDCDGHKDGDLLQDHLVPTGTKNFLSRFMKDEGYQYVCDAIQYIIDYKAAYASQKYPPTFHTTDALLVQSGHVLLIKRRHHPGKGQWALPGGFLKIDLSLLDSMFSELYEETNIDIPEKVLLGSIKFSKPVDDVDRSDRGRVITQVYYMKLEDRPKLPKVRPADDAKEARWFPINEIRRDMMFEDHYDIIFDILGYPDQSPILLDTEV